ncbi:glycogen(starch) synthase [Microbacterium sp. W4I4]|uniref:glycosyltransferase family 4 protein n=1 Tax=Microbacterium sp. W4I4 TaxID=3042295 RepID=UPI00278BAC8A|nr:glycosyltransferase family 4 protein [Microbacterium sp. W4I4]MDQ0613773.1 glycogen(starch) synthase [Microbacterium sp. W4I4]
MAVAEDGRRLRVALIASSYAPHVGGVEEHVAQVARALDAHGHVVEVWTVDRGERTQDSAPFPVRYLPTPLPARSISAMLRYATTAIGARRRWAAAAGDLRPDVLVVQCFGPNGIYALRLHRRTGIPLVVVSHGETLGDDNGAFVRSRQLRTALREALSTASAHAAPSRYVLDDLTARFGAGEGTIIPNGVAPLPRLGSVVRADDLIIAVGRLGRMKGFDLLIDAITRVDGARLEIVGGGPERDALQQQIDEAGLSDRVRLVGARDAAGVAERIAAATAVVVPSRSESFGIVALEAWRGGAPLIVTSRGGAAEFVQDGEGGLLVDPLDIDALADAMRRMLDDAGLRERLARKGAERVKAFSWPRVALLYEMMLDAIVRRSRKPR